MRLCAISRLISPDFVFVYFGTVDEAGHAHGWMSDGYLAQLGRVDQALATLINGLPQDAVLLVQSDHGGHDRSHGTDMAEDMTIPWLVSGPGIKRGYPIIGPVSLLDTAPTLAHFLNIAPDKIWEGAFCRRDFGNLNCQNHERNNYDKIYN